MNRNPRGCKRQNMWWEAWPTTHLTDRYTAVIGWSMLAFSASKMTYIVSGGASNSTHSLADHRPMSYCVVIHAVVLVTQWPSNRS